MALVKIPIVVEKKGDGAKQVTAELKQVEAQAKKTDAEIKGFGSGLDSAANKGAKFADSVGKTSTVLARSADVIGLNASAFRALDDVADVAELGFNNLSKSAAGFNAASLGVAAAGFSVGYMLGGLIRQIPGVAAAADAAAASLYKMFTGIDPSKATAGMKEWQKEMAGAAATARAMRIEGAGGLEGMVISTKKARDEAKLLKDASEAAGMTIKNIDEAKAILKVEEDAKKATKAMEELKNKAKELFAALEKEALRGSMADEEKGIKLAEDALDRAANEMLRLSKAAEEAGLDVLAADAAQAADELAMSYEMAADETKNLVKGTFDWQGALQGIALLAGALGGKFGDVVNVVGNIGEAFKNAKTSADKFNAIASGIGQIGGVIGGKAGGALQGAAGGAMLGFSVGGPIGAVAGGVIGGIMGFFKKKKEQMVKEAQQAGKDIADAIAKGMSVSSFIPKLLKDKQTALATFDQLGQQFADMQAKYKAAILESTKGAVSGLTAMLAYLGKKTGDTTADFARMGTYVMGLFGALRKQGLSFVDAIEQLKPALEEMQKQAEAKGQVLTGGAADLANFAAIIEANQELVAAAEGAGQVLEGLRVSGSLTQETFSALQTDVQGYLTELEATGLTSSQALAVAAPSLYQLKKAHEELGLVLDAETQAAIDAAEAQGLFEGMSDPMEEMVKAMNAMVEVMAAIAQSFGVTLPAAVQEYIDSINKIPAIPVPGAATTETGAPGGGPGGESSAGGLGARILGFGHDWTGALGLGKTRMDTASAAGGYGDVLAFRPKVFKRDTLLQVHRGEAGLIIPAGQHGFSAAGGFGVSMSGASVTINVHPSPGMSEGQLADLVAQRLNEVLRTNQAGVVTRMEQARRRQYGNG